ncbi:hypothetical protein OIY81_1631 [Cryptosporidium canis]|uniref:BSD domain-containing protein n=1 Tax=Cryptosporidium canis TaxID=195482 RepID=A0ABQ8P3B7_9CRYT|nr:hypothetical protein OJ252_3110 [Cryptosporidium canis]KAJ1611618.1 hypothetical protein OIY81_1631 [Cryptosporidium canis]
MGIVESVEDLTHEMELEMKDFDETMQDHIFPWFHIVQWSSEELPTNTVLKWNYKSIKEKVQSLTLNKQVFLTNCPISRIPKFSLDEDDPDCTIPFAEWAAALLSQMDDLSNVRYELVPSRMSEGIFWQSYFNAIRNIIIKDVIISMEQSEAPIANNAPPVRRYREINENEISEENVPDFYKNDIIYESNASNITKDDTHLDEQSFQMSPDEHLVGAKGNDLEIMSNEAVEENRQLSGYENHQEAEFVNSSQEQDQDLDSHHNHDQDLHHNQGLDSHHNQGQDLHHNHDQDLDSHHNHDQDLHHNHDQDQKAIDEHQQKTETIKAKQEPGADYELYTQDNYIYNDRNFKSDDNQLDIKVDDICAGQVYYSGHHFNNSECEQELNDPNSCNNIDDHTSALFSEEIPINQE